jgi:Tfp pilus assembly protein PilF
MKARTLFVALFVLFSGALAQMSPEAKQLYDQAVQLRAQAQRSYPKANIDYPLWTQAAEAAEKAVSAAPNEREPLRLRAEIYTQVGFWAKAESAWNAYFAAASDYDPSARAGMSEVQLNLGYSAYQRGARAEAERYFTAAVQSNPQNQRALVWQARTALERGDGNTAVPLLEQAVNLKPNDKVAQYALLVARKSAAYGATATEAFFIGYSAYEQGEKDSALEQFKAATVAAPNFTEAQRWLGRTALDLNQGAVAAKAYEAVVKLEGATPETTYNLNLSREVAQFGLEAATAFRAGYDQYTKGDKSGAAQLFQTAVAANPNYQKAWAWLGRVRFETNDFKGAADAYGQAVKLDPSDKSSAFFLKQAQAKLGR